MLQTTTWSMEWNVVSVFALAAILALVNVIGFARLADSLVSFYDFVLGGASYRAYRAQWSQLTAVRAELAGVSAQDEFARWARLQRRVDAAQAEFDRTAGERGRSRLSRGMRCSLLVRMVYYAIMIWLWWRAGTKTRIPVPIAWRLLGGQTLSLFGRDLVNTDGVALLALLTIFMQASSRLFCLIL